MEPGVDHLHAGVPERRGDHLGTPVVAVEARLRDEHPDGTRQRVRGGGHEASLSLSKSSARDRSEPIAAHPSGLGAPCGTSSTAGMPAAFAPRTSTSYRSPT